MTDCERVFNIHPEWFEELFRWLSLRSDYSSQYVLYGMKHYSFVFGGDVSEKYCLLDLFDWSQTTSYFGLTGEYFPTLDEDWKKYFRNEW